MNQIQKRLMLLGVAAFLVAAPACAKKPKAAGEEAKQEAAAGKAAGEEKSAKASEEDIPAGNQGTLDEQGRVREASAKDGEREAAAGGDVAAGAEVAVDAVHFDYDSSELSGDARGTLDEVKKLLGRNKGWKVTLEGHCDERGTEEYNLGLGQRRANSARQYLLSQGVAKSRLDTVSFGKTRPAVQGSDEAAWARNRRVEFGFTKGK